MSNIGAVCSGPKTLNLLIIHFLYFVNARLSICGGFSHF